MNTNETIKCFDSEKDFDVYKNLNYTYVNPHSNGLISWLGAPDYQEDPAFEDIAPTIADFNNYFQECISAKSSSFISALSDLIIEYNTQGYLNLVFEPSYMLFANQIREYIYYYSRPFQLAPDMRVDLIASYFDFDRTTYEVVSGYTDSINPDTVHYTHPEYGTHCVVNILEHPEIMIFIEKGGVLVKSKLSI